MWMIQTSPPASHSPGKWSARWGLSCSWRCAGTLAQKACKADKTKTSPDLPQTGKASAQWLGNGFCGCSPGSWSASFSGCQAGSALLWMVRLKGWAPDQWRPHRAWLCSTPCGKFARLSIAAKPNSLPWKRSKDIVQYYTYNNNKLEQNRIEYNRR